MSHLAKVIVFSPDRLLFFLSRMKALAAAFLLLPVPVLAQEEATRTLSYVANGEATIQEEEKSIKVVVTGGSKGIGKGRSIEAWFGVSPGETVEVYSSRTNADGSGCGAWRIVCGDRWVIAGEGGGSAPSDSYTSDAGAVNAQPVGIAGGQGKRGAEWCLTQKDNPNGKGQIWEKEETQLPRRGDFFITSNGMHVATETYGSTRARNGAVFSYEEPHCLEGDGWGIGGALSANTSEVDNDLTISTFATSVYGGGGSGVSGAARYTDLGATGIGSGGVTITFYKETVGVPPAPSPPSVVRVRTARPDVRRIEKGSGNSSLKIIAPP